MLSHHLKDLASTNDRCNYQAYNLPIWRTNPTFWRTTSLTGVQIVIWHLSMPRPPKTIVPKDPEHQPHIKKFVSEGKKGVSVVIGGKTNSKIVQKKRRRRSTGETKTNSQKRRPPLLSETFDPTTSETNFETLVPKMAATTLDPSSPNNIMLQEIKNMEERLKASMKENREKEISDMEIKMKAIIENSMKESIASISNAINNTISSNPIVQSNVGNIQSLKMENITLKKELQQLSAEQTKLKLQMNKIESRSLEYTIIMRGIHEEPRETEDSCCDKIYRELANTVSGSDPDERYRIAKTLTIRKCRRLGKFKRDRIRPICVEFVHKEDRSYVLENRSYLNEGVFVDKEYPPEIERTRRSLLPILRAAKRLERYRDQSRMNYDKVVIDGKDYTMTNLHELPEDINSFKATSKSDTNTVGFFGEANPLSNFHPAKFTYNGVAYISSEQFIQATKASFFGDTDTYTKIMGCKTSFDCKQMSWNIQNLDSQKWDAAAMTMCEPGIREKFVQNPHLMDTLIRRTENKTIIECANDRLWGTGTALGEEGCLEKNRWITQGILGRILERIRSEFLSSTAPPTTTAPLAYTSTSNVQSLYNVTPTTNVQHGHTASNANPSFMYPAQQHIHPPPGINHPMVTIARQPNVFTPTVLPVLTPEPTGHNHQPSIIDESTKPSLPTVAETTDSAESMDAQT